MGFVNRNFIEKVFYLYSLVVKESLAIMSINPNLINMKRLTALFRAQFPWLTLAFVLKMTLKMSKA